MIIWWTTMIAILGSMGTILLSIVMLVIVGSETAPQAIFWFFVAACATGVLILAIRAENSPAMRSVSFRATKSVPVSKPAPVQSKYWIVYHGTPTWTNAAGAIQDGFVPGPGNKFGTAVYTTFDIGLAREYARGGGYVFKIYINKQVPFKWYHQIPGKDHEQKRAYCLQHGIGLVFHQEHKFFISYGQQGVPVLIPGLAMVEVFDEFGNPITIQ